MWKDSVRGGEKRKRVKGRKRVQEMEVERKMGRGEDGEGERDGRGERELAVGSGGEVPRRMDRRSMTPAPTEPCIISDRDKRSVRVA